MTTTELITPPDGSPAADPSSDAHADPHPSRSERPSPREVLEIAPVIGVVAVAGPPVILLAGPLVLFALMVAGPFLLLLTLVALLIASTVLFALIVAILASPYVLVRHLRERRAGAQPAFTARAPRLRAAAHAIHEG